MSKLPATEMLLKASYKRLFLPHSNQLNVKGDVVIQTSIKRPIQGVAVFIIDHAKQQGSENSQRYIECF